MAASYLGCLRKVFSRGMLQVRSAYVHVYTKVRRCACDCTCVSYLPVLPPPIFPTILQQYCKWIGQQGTGQ